ncbi:MAG TPA: hypothetical protein V6D19_05415 [Stenomitos sp.]
MAKDKEPSESEIIARMKWIEEELNRLHAGCQTRTLTGDYSRQLTEEHGELAHTHYALYGNW